MASSDLTWTASIATVNQLAEYRIYRATKVGSADIGPFVLIGTNVVERDAFGAITNPVTVLTFSDATVNFGTETYQYRVDAIPVFVGEAPSPQTPPGVSNIVALGTQPSAVVLSGVTAAPDISLSWTASTPALNPVVSYRVFRSVSQGPYSLLATVLAPTLTYLDTDVELNVLEYDYFVVAVDEIGIVSEASNVVNFGFSVDFLIGIATNDLAATEYNRIITSDDGIAWVGSQVADRFWLDLLFDPDFGTAGRILALKDSPDDAVWYSDDGGQTWQPAVTPAVVDGWTRFAYSTTLGRMAAVSNDVSTNGNKIMTSDDDGETWTLRSTPVSMDGLAWNAMIWDPILSLFIAGLASGTTDKIATSADGITWSHITTPNGNGDGVTDDFAIAIGGSFDNRKVGANRGNNSNFYSDDAVTWTNVPVPNGWAGGATSIAYGAGLFVALAGGAAAVETSPDGITWTNRPLGGPSGTWEEIMFSVELGLFIVLGTAAPDKILTSPDGITWTLRTEPAFANMQWGAIIQARKPSVELRQEMVMCSRALVPAVSGFSVTGASWSENDPGNTVQMDAIAYSPTLGLWMMCGGGSPSEFFSSPDGVVWSPVTSGVPGSGSFEIIDWVDNLAMFVASRTSGGGTQAIITCTDGINWVQQTLPNGSAFQDTVSSSLAGRAVGVGLNGFTNPTGNVLWTDDGATWTAPVAAHASNNVRTVVFDTVRDRFCALQANGECNVSTDNTGTAWSLNINSADLAGSSPAFVAFAPGLDRLVAATNTGLYSSDDGGVNWIQRESDDYEDVAWSTVLEKFIAINGGGPPRMMHSADGITWLEQPDPAEGGTAWSGLALGDAV